ncbi:MAG: AmmeMemoRadiSam system protein B [Planctomycetota bacterium]|nr:MAG: AmmeMemoRadiSam system protein B [Planctomycetota bacterium]
MSVQRPALRPFLEPVPIRLPEAEGQPLFLIRDPFRLSEQQLVVPPAGVAVLQLLDGSRTVAEVQEEFARRYGVQPPAQEVTTLVDRLAEAKLLAGPHLRACLEEFARQPVREPACIGSYPGEPAALRSFLDAQFARAGGPGGGPESAPAGAPVRGVIAPHIDPERGGHAYAWAWRELAAHCEADLFVIFGTSHAGTGPIDGDPATRAARYALTRKSYRTPLGDLPTDAELVDRLLEAYRGPDDLFAGEFHHRGEHSIEFQALFLAHLLAPRRPVRILPVLCGGLHDLRGGAPTDDEGFLAFHEALRAALAEIPPERVAFIASIDLAHVGAQFHQPPADRTRVEEAAAADRETLRLALEERDAAAVHADLEADLERPEPEQRNVCGHSALVALVHALSLGGAPLRGELLTYDAWHDGASAVGFAAGVYREEA